MIGWIVSLLALPWQEDEGRKQSLRYNKEKNETCLPGKLFKKVK